jgi:phosphoglycolate phosphatase-like HAD superfamily hydrolase
MIFTAAERYNIDLSQSWMIGDTQVDYETAINAGVKPIVTDNLLNAVKQILGE